MPERGGDAAGRCPQSGKRERAFPEKYPKVRPLLPGERIRAASRAARNSENRVDLGLAASRFARCAAIVMIV